MLNVIVLNAVTSLEAKIMTLNIMALKITTLRITVCPTLILFYLAIMLTLCSMSL